jgi:hypothetical protein
MIKLPENLVNLLGQKIEVVKTTKTLNFQDRLIIYRMFGITNYPDNFQKVKERLKNVTFPTLTPADLTFCWLGIITSSHILSIWHNFIEEEYEYDEEYTWLYELPSRLLTLAEELISGKADWQSSFERTFHSEYYHTIGHIDSQVNEKALWVCYAAYQTLVLIFTGYFGIDYTNDYFLMGEGNYGPEEYYDFAQMASKAYSAIDENEEVGGKIRLERLNRYKPIKYDLEKQAEFWLWWLTEAIPQAWKLAHRQQL